MHPRLEALIAANSQFEKAKRAVVAAEDLRRQCAADLVHIEDQAERTEAAIEAYQAFGKGLSLVLAEAVTGLPGRRGQSEFLVLANRKTYQPKGRVPRDRVVEESEPMSEWPAPDALQREVMSAHIKRDKPYWLEHFLDWTIMRVSLDPDESRAFLKDPTAAMAAHHDMTREAFVEWLSSGGRVLCGDTYKGGKPCAAQVAGTTGFMSIERWKAAKAAGGYCKQHGGAAHM
ncbi:MAG: hypothetical protein ACREE0_07410 [Phenylobacterium sp.]